MSDGGDEKIRDIDDGPELANLAPGPKEVREKNPAFPEGAKPLLVACNACKKDITRWCMITIVPSPNGPMPMVLQPGRCPRCDHPLFFFSPGSPVIVPQPTQVPKGIIRQ